MSDKPKYRRVKNREPFATTIKLGYGSIIDELSSETRIAKSKLVDEALELLFEKYKKDKAPKVGVDSNGEEPLDGQISVEEALQNIKEEPRVQNKQNSIDNHNNVRMARAVTNIDNSNFAKKILTLVDEELLREAIRNFKKKRGKNATFLIQLVIDEYFKNGVELSKCLVNLLNKGLKGSFVLPY